MTALVGLARAAPLVFLAPLFGPSWWVRAAALFVLVFASSPAWSAAAHPRLTVLLHEVLIGSVLGLAAAIPLRAAEAAGALVSFTSARTSGARNPIFREQARWSLLYLVLGLAVFAAFSGPHMVVGAFLKSYQLFPVGAGISSTTQPVFQLAAELSAIAISIAAPILAALLAASMVLGTVQRAQPFMTDVVDHLTVRSLVLVLCTGLLAATLLERSILPSAADRLMQALRLLQAR